MRRVLVWVSDSSVCSAYSHQLIWQRNNHVDPQHTPSRLQMVPSLARRYLVSDIGWRIYAIQGLVSKVHCFQLGKAVKDLGLHST